MKKLILALSIAAVSFSVMAGENAQATSTAHPIDKFNDPANYAGATYKHETRIGTLEYIGGYPTDETVQKANDQIDLQRATQVYLEFMPMMANVGMYDMHAGEGVEKNGDVTIFTHPGHGKSGTVGLTYNTESVYMSTTIDLTDGPVILNVPPRVLGIVNDTFMRWSGDLGMAGQDRGQGGKYVVVPPHYEGKLPKDHFVIRNASNRAWVMTRVFIEDSGIGPENVLPYYRKHLQIYNMGEEPRKDAKYINSSNQGHNSLHARDITYFKRLHAELQVEADGFLTPYQLGLLQTIGIEKGKPFNPDKRMTAILEEGIQIGDAYANANAYASRLPGIRSYEGSSWEQLFYGGTHNFTIDGVLNLDALTLFHYEAIVITPAMARKMPGIGSQYLVNYRDNNDNFLMGENTYKVTLPANIPAKDFWSFTLYHPDTRSLLQNGEDKPSVSTHDNPVMNEDGTYTLWVGPELPKGAPESNWVKTIPNQGWSTMFRLYGPLEAYFDGEWQPGEIEIVK